MERDRGGAVGLGVGRNTTVEPAGWWVGCIVAGGTLARDIQFLSALAADNGLNTPLIGGVIPSNRAHRVWAHGQLRRRIGPLAGRRIALLGPEIGDLNLLWLG